MWSSSGIGQSLFFGFGEENERVNSAGNSVPVLREIPEAQWVRSTEDDTAPLETYNPVRQRRDSTSSGTVGGGEKKKKRRKSTKNSDAASAAGGYPGAEEDQQQGGDDDDDRDDNEKEGEEEDEEYDYFAKFSGDAKTVACVGAIVDYDSLCQRNPAMQRMRQEHRNLRKRFRLPIIGLESGPPRAPTPLGEIFGRLTNTKVSSFAAAIIAVLFVLRMRRPLLSSKVQKRVLQIRQEEEMGRQAAKERVLSRKFYGASSRSMSLHLKKQRESMKIVLTEGVKKSTRRLNITKFDRNAGCAHDDDSKTTHFHQRDDPMRRSELFSVPAGPAEDKLFDRTQYKDDTGVAGEKKELPLYLRRTSFVGVVNPDKRIYSRHDAADEAAAAAAAAAAQSNGENDQDDDDEAAAAGNGAVLDDVKFDNSGGGPKSGGMLEKSQSMHMREFGEVLFDNARQNPFKSEFDLFHVPTRDGPMPQFSGSSSRSGGKREVPAVTRDFSSFGEEAGGEEDDDATSPKKKKKKKSVKVLDSEDVDETKDEMNPLAAFTSINEAEAFAIPPPASATADAAAAALSPTELHDPKMHTTKLSLVAKAQAGNLPATKNLFLWDWCWKDEPFEPPHPSLPSLSAQVAASGNKRQVFSLAERDATKYVTQVKDSELSAFAATKEAPNMVEDLVALRNCFSDVVVAVNPSGMDGASSSSSNSSSKRRGSRSAAAGGETDKKKSDELTQQQQQQQQQQQDPKKPWLRGGKQQLAKEALVATRTSASFEPFALHFGMEHSQFVRRSMKELSRQIEVHREIYQEKRERLMGDTAGLRSSFGALHEERELQRQMAREEGERMKQHRKLELEARRASMAPGELLALEKNKKNNNAKKEEDTAASAVTEQRSGMGGMISTTSGLIQQHQKEAVFNSHHLHHIQTVDQSVRKQLTDQCDIDIRQYSVDWFRRLRTKVDKTMNGGLKVNRHMEKVFDVFEPVFETGILTQQVFEKTVVLKLFGKALLERSSGGAGGGGGGGRAGNSSMSKQSGRMRSNATLSSSGGYRSNTSSPRNAGAAVAVAAPGGTISPTPSGISAGLSSTQHPIPKAAAQIQNEGSGVSLTSVGARSLPPPQNTERSSGSNSHAPVRSPLSSTTTTRHATVSDARPTSVPQQQQQKQLHHHQSITNAGTARSSPARSPLSAPITATATAAEGDDDAFRLPVLDALSVPTNEECVLVDLGAQFALNRLRVAFNVTKDKVKDLIVRSGATYALMSAEEVDIVFRNDAAGAQGRNRVQRLSKLEDIMARNKRIESCVEEGRKLAERRLRESRQLKRIITRGAASSSNAGSGSGVGGAVGGGSSSAGNTTNRNAAIAAAAVAPATGSAFVSSERSSPLNRVAPQPPATARLPPIKGLGHRPNPPGAGAPAASARKPL